MENVKFPSLKFLRLCPLFLLLTVWWGKGTELGSEEGKGMGNELTDVCLNNI
jgi:hypothetical protein